MQLVQSIEKSKQSNGNMPEPIDFFEKEVGEQDSCIVALIPRGEVIRNFVHSGILDEIEANTRLSLFTVSPEAETDRMLRERFSHVHPLTEYREKWLIRFQREIIDIAHGRWLWSRAAQERWRLRDSEAKTIRQKTLRAIKKALSLPFASDSGINILTKTERVSSRLLNPTDEYTNLYKTIKPSLVFNGSHIHSRNAIQAIQSAQWLGIPTATFIFSWDNLTSQGRIILPYDYFLVWNESLKKQLLDMYGWIKSENVFVTGTPQFDFHFQPKFYLSRAEYCSQIGADPDRPIVLYTTGMPNHMPGEPEIVEEIADMLAVFADSEEPQLLVRVYARKYLQKLRKLLPSRVSTRWMDMRRPSQRSAI